MPFSLAEGASNEASLRVAFVYKFIKFIEWPGHSLAPSLRLCALGATDDAKAALLPLNGQAVSTQILEGIPVVKQAIELVYLDDQRSAGQQLQSCQILYRPSGGLTITVPQPLPAGVLLIADDPQPSEANVGIALRRNYEGRIEFSISQAATQHAGVIISSQLLKLNSAHGGKN